MSASKTRFKHLAGIGLLIFLGSLSACGQKAKTSTSTVLVPVDTTIVDDDTLEVDDVPKSKQTEHAR